MAAYFYGMARRVSIRFNDHLRRRGWREHGSCLRIYEISGSLGHRGADYFKRLFKRYNGQTPSDTAGAGNRTDMSQRSKSEADISGLALLYIV